MSILHRLFTAGLQLVAFSVLALALTSPGSVAASAGADDDASIGETKAEWQGEYRRLLSDKALLQRNLEAARASYSKSRRRNYPRGAAREQFLIEADTAEKELVKVEAEIKKLKSDARREGILPGWLYEVEQGPLDAPRPAAPTEEDPQDRDGRNPLYLDSE